jgi:hypothetical protein
LLAPVAVLEIPADRHFQALLERPLRLPAEFAADLRRVDRVTSIVSRPIRDEGLE